MHMTSASTSVPRPASAWAARRAAHCLTSLAVLGGALCGCAQGPNEAEFVQACMASSQPQIVTEAMCQCGAREARGSLPPELYRAMVLDMQGRKQEAEASVGDLSFEKRADFAMKQFAILGKCLQTR
jgi:hypothetical protein